MNNSSVDTKEAESAPVFPASVIGAMADAVKDDESEPMSDEEFWAKLTEMATRLVKLCEIERDVINAHEQRVLAARRFAAAMKRGDKQDATAQLIRWSQLAPRVEHHTSRLTTAAAEALAEIEG
ncbi:MAG: hypothetical protein WC683_02385 [bacterium]